MAQETPCPNDETLTDYIEGRLTETQRTLVETHLSSCSACREIAMVSAELVFGDPMGNIAPVPEAVTRRTVARVAGSRKKRLSSQIFEQSRQWVAKGFTAIEAFALGPQGAPATLRGDAAKTAGAVVRREKQFGDLRFAVELEKTGDEGATIRVAWSAGRPQGKTVRMALMARQRELASALLADAPVLFEEIAFGTYTLIFVLAGEKIGEYSFEIKATPE
ncbi:MAG: zf-HC2 domain-containing protein [Desulfatitalea sp.]